MYCALPGLYVLGVASICGAFLHKGVPALPAAAASSMILLAAHRCAHLCPMIL